MKLSQMCHISNVFVHGAAEQRQCRDLVLEDRIQWYQQSLQIPDNEQRCREHSTTIYKTCLEYHSRKTIPFIPSLQQSRKAQLIQSTQQQQEPRIHHVRTKHDLLQVRPRHRRDFHSVREPVSVGHLLVRVPPTQL